VLEAPKLGRVAHDMHSRAGVDYGELLLEQRKWTTVPSGLCHAARPQGRQPCLRVGMAITEHILDWANHWYGLIN
jgi:hypothetical protein